MTIRQVKTAVSSVEVYKVPGSTMEEAFHVLKTQHNLDNYNLEALTPEETPNMLTGFVMKKSQQLHNKFINNEISEFTIYGALYNAEPQIVDEEKVVVKNIVSRGTKKWETVNSYQNDSGLVLHVDTGTKAEAMEVAETLAMTHRTSINIILSKRLVEHDGILGLVEFHPASNVDTGNIYVFWKYNVKVTVEDEDNMLDNAVVQEANGQLALFEDITTYETRKMIMSYSTREFEKN